MSKYEPLKHYLERLPGAEAPLTFADVEEVLGFPLPDSARRHPAWWSNNTGTHVGVSAWRDAGWKTARVDLGAEKVTFVREHAESASAAGAARNPSAPAESIYLPLAMLSKTALRLMDDVSEETGFDRARAVAAILDGCAMERRRRLLESFSVGAPKAAFDSVTAVREDRDGR